MSRFIGLFLQKQFKAFFVLVVTASVSLALVSYYPNLTALILSNQSVLLSLSLVFVSNYWSRRAAPRYVFVSISLPEFNQCIVHHGPSPG